MISIDHDIKIKDRKHAAALLSQLLLSDMRQNAVVTAIPPGGAIVGYHIAKSLNLPLKIISCKGIEHPSDSNKSIGSVCENENVIHSYDRGIPTDYISHQLNKLQHFTKIENDIYNQGKEDISLKYKTVILVNDVLKNPDSMLACIKSIRKEKPIKIVAVVAYAVPEAARIISEEVDELLFLQMEPAHLIEDFRQADDEETAHFFDPLNQIVKLD